MANTFEQTIRSLCHLLKYLGTVSKIFFSIAMTVPNYQSFLLPTLQHLGNGEEYPVRKIYDLLANQLELTEEDRQQLLPSGRQKTYQNRIGWAILYLSKAGLIHKPKRGYAIITHRGRELLAQKPEILTANSLRIFPEYQAFYQSNRPVGK